MRFHPINLTLIFFLLHLTPACAQRSLPQGEDEFQAARNEMVENDLKGRDITDQRVLEAMTKVPRHLLVPEEVRPYAYEDRPIPIGYNQTISQPYIVALMTQLADPESSDRALEVGTGSGYQAAVLGEIANEVYTIEIVPELAARARQDLEELGYENIQVRQGDGYRGWPDKAPFDLIIVTAAPPSIPRPLKDQLAEGGRMVIPVGPVYAVQELMLLEKKNGKISERSVIPVRFVPMTGEAQQP